MTWISPTSRGLVLGSVPDVGGTEQELLQFSCVGELKTVYRKLEAAGCEALMRDPLVRTATMEILPEGKTRPQIQVRLFCARCMKFDIMKIDLMV